MTFTDHVTPGPAVSAAHTVQCDDQPPEEAEAADSDQPGAGPARHRPELYPGVPGQW